MTRRFSGRPLERSLAVTNGKVRCPRNARLSVTACDGCPFFCRTDGLTSSLICSYPIPARDTFARRARQRPDVALALTHHLERT